MRFKRQESGELGRGLLLHPTAVATDEGEEQGLELPKKLSLRRSTLAMSGGGDEDAGGAFWMDDPAC